MSHDHSHGTENVSDARLLWSVLINQFLTVAQVIAGLASGSVALLSDAAHNFNDANALLIAYIARRFSRKEANARFTFGYRRAELIGAVINLTLLAVIGLYLVYEGIARFFDPTQIIGWLMAAAAGLAIVIDVGTAVLLWAMSKGSLNVRAAFIHNLVDTLGSVAVLIGAGAIIWLDWTWIDPVLTLLIAGYVLWQVVKMLPTAVRILMEGTPADIDLAELAERMSQTDGIASVHHLHAWELDEHHRALEAHVVLGGDGLNRWPQIKKQLKELLQGEFGIGHTALEPELVEESEGRCQSRGLVSRH